MLIIKWQGGFINPFDAEVKMKALLLMSKTETPSIEYFVMGIV